MTTTNLPQIFTPQEIAEYLKVSEAAVLEMFEIGAIQGFKISSEWRCFEPDLIEFLKKQKPPHSSYEPKPERTSDTPITTFSFSEIEGFIFSWPAAEEAFEKGYETTEEIGNRTRIFRIGIGERTVVGQLRKHIVVWLDRYIPLVEFNAGNDYASDGLLVSLIKLPGGKQLWPDNPVPTEYRGFKIVRYDSIVRGKYSRKTLAVAVHKDDLDSMVHHAIIRAQQKGYV